MARLAPHGPAGAARLRGVWGVCLSTRRRQLSGAWCGGPAELAARRFAGTGKDFERVSVANVRWMQRLGSDAKGNAPEGAPVLKRGAATPAA